MATTMIMIMISEYGFQFTCCFTNKPVSDGDLNHELLGLYDIKCNRLLQQFNNDAEI